MNGGAVCTARSTAYRRLPVLLTAAREQAAFAGRRIRVTVRPCTVVTPDTPLHPTFVLEEI